ncbi:MAG: hypothetical protein E7263_07760 [Lachnospiraceae bacterium]|nr:hypothetical protein [Lachnospiraceae bacterium]
MRSKRLLVKAFFGLVVAFCMGVSLLGGANTLQVKAESTEGIGSSITLDEEVTGDFSDEGSLVDASYTTVSCTYDFSTAYEILSIVNQKRAAAGLPALTMDRDLLEAAMFRSVEISECWNHVRPNGLTCFSICSKANGENIAYGYRDAAHVMEGWMNSEGHRENILGAGYKSIGIGVVIIGGRKYYAQLFSWDSATALSSVPDNQAVNVNIPMTADSPTVFPSVQYDKVLPTYTDGETVFPKTDITTKYVTHIQSYGWSHECKDGIWDVNGQISGSLGLSKRMEAIKIDVSGNENLGIRYKTHVQSYGWENGWSAGGNTSGTMGKGKRLEAIMIELTGADSSKYDVYYRVHAQSYGWLGWAKNGQPAGTAGQSKRLEAIQVIVVPKGTAPSGVIGYSYIEVGKSADNGTCDGMINYSTHVQTYGDQSYVYDGSVSGTFGEAKRLEGIRINLNNDMLGYDGDVVYTTHVQTYGWQGDETDITTWATNGSMSGTSGEAKRLEAIRIKLTGEIANYYDVFYRVHSQTFGWLGWAKNGAPAGTAGYAKRLEGIQIVLLPKGSPAPSTNPGSAGTSAYISK